MSRDHDSETDPGGASRTADLSLEPSQHIADLSLHTVVECLRRHGGERSLIRLAGDVLTEHRGEPPTTAEVRETYRYLYRNHLQQLQAAELVEYSERDGTVRLTSPAENGIYSGRGNYR